MSHNDRPEKRKRQWAVLKFFLQTYIHAFGLNSDGELGNQKKKIELSPHRIKIETKFIDISSRWNKFISIALAQKGICYIWGRCGEEIIRTPKPTNFESLQKFMPNISK